MTNAGTRRFGRGSVAMDEPRRQLERFIGEWTMHVAFPGAPPVAGGRVVFEWMSGEQFLIERWEVPVPEAPDFSPLDFAQRFTGTFSDDGTTIAGRWEIAHDGSTWEHDFDLTYVRVG